MTFFLSIFTQFPSRKCIWKGGLRNRRDFASACVYIGKWWNSHAFSKKLIILKGKDIDRCDLLWVRLAELLQFGVFLDINHFARMIWNYNEQGTWWRHQMEIFFRVTGPLCGEFTGEFPSQRPVMQSFGVLFDLCLNKRLSKQSWSWWFEAPSRSLWRHFNETFHVLHQDSGSSSSRFLI